MRVAVVYPEVLDLARFKEKRKEFPPFGPLYLASVIEEDGHSVSLLKINPAQWLLDLRGYDAVAFSISASATYGLIKKARMLSFYDPDTFVMVGGVHANFFPERTLLDIKPDVVGVGEGETTILELLRAGKGGNFGEIPGVCFLKDGVVRRTKPRELIKDLDALPMPARHLMDKRDFLMTDRLSTTNMKLAHVMFSRGCPFPCTFCASAHTKMQIRSGASCRQELIQLKENYGIEGFAIVDDNFIVHKKKVVEICRSIKDLGLKWSALSRVDTVNDDLLKEMFDAGCIELKFGIESGSETILAAMKKNTTREQISRAVRSAKAIGMNVKAFVIHGYPGENRATTAETIQLLGELNSSIDRVSIFRFVPLPGTHVYQNADLYQIHGTDSQPGWAGEWERYHIHHNDHHWWGDENDFRELNQAYRTLTDFVATKWIDRHAAKPVLLANEP